MQIAYYEMYGIEGMRAFAETLRYASEKGMFVMTDAKRNDIGATAECYAKAYLGETQVGESSYTAFDSDFLTVNGYLGSDGIKPFLNWMDKRDKGIFVLVKTSNKSSGELQDLKLENGKTVYEYIGSLVEEWGKGSIGKSPRNAAYLFPDPRLRRAGRQGGRFEGLLRQGRFGRYRQLLPRNSVRIQAGKIRGHDI